VCLELHFLLPISVQVFYIPYGVHSVSNEKIIVSLRFICSGKNWNLSLRMSYKLSFSLVKCIKRE
jgi:hypothetical protein